MAKTTTQHIHSITSVSVASDEVAPDVRAEHIWGASMLTMHDRVWASRGVQVVRPGGEPVCEDGPVLYLLLSPAALVEFDLNPVIKQMHWMKPRAVRIRIVDRHETPYTERVLCDEQSNLLGIRRAYYQKTAATGRAWITDDAALALRWHNADSPREAQAYMRGLAREKQTSPLVLDGCTQYAHSDDSFKHWLAMVAPHWNRADAVFSDVYEYSPGVWVHTSAEIDPQAQFIGPVWIGAGRSVQAGSIVIGPAVIADSALVDRPQVGAVAWDEVRSPHWELPSIIDRNADARRFVKRLFDIVFSLFVLIVTLPLYPIVMLLIYLEDGRPFFFSHERQTIGGRNFPCYKFRSMCRNADEMKEELQALNLADGAQTNIPEHLDPRILKIGRILRKTQIDELPQFWNVLLGHMSVVGPRPSPDKENQYCPAWREARLSVRPGITGLWQIRRTREAMTDFQEWIRYDLEYVRHQSLGRDITIILETIKQVIKTLIEQGTKRWH